MAGNTKVDQLARASRAWGVLTDIAGRDEVITYGELAKRLRIHHRTIRFVLGPIQQHCLDNNLPPITILVVNAITGDPGDGFIATSDETDTRERAYRKVYRKNWASVANPFLAYEAGANANDEELVNLLTEFPDSSSEVYRKIRQRGRQQQLFRAVLVRAYGGACAFCGISIPEILEAAHIIPWTKARREDAFSPTNGLLLCRNHHRLFDDGLLTVDGNMAIKCRVTHPRRRRPAPADRQTACSLDGRKVRLPESERLRPSTDLLARRFASF